MTQTLSRSGATPVGATAKCRGGTFSFSQHRSGTCSHPGDVVSASPEHSCWALPTALENSTPLFAYARSEAPLGFPEPTEELAVEYEQEALHHFDNDV